MRSRLTALVAPLLAGGLLLATAAPSSARVLDRWAVEVSETGTATDFCGVDGLDPTYTFDATFRGFTREQGRDKLVYYAERSRIVQTFTYDGMTVTDIAPNTLGKDLKVVDNGDGTLSITVLMTGGNRLVGSDGKLLAKADGQVRFLLLWDLETDSLISEELIFGSTGTNDDFCEAILGHWGV